MSESRPCGWCKTDPVRKGKVCCTTHNLVVCSGCKGTDSYIKAHQHRWTPFLGNMACVVCGAGRTSMRHIVPTLVRR